MLLVLAPKRLGDERVTREDKPNPTETPVTLTTAIASVTASSSSFPRCPQNTELTKPMRNTISWARNAGPARNRSAPSSRRRSASRRQRGARRSGLSARAPGPGVSSSAASMCRAPATGSAQEAEGRTGRASRAPVPALGRPPPTLGAPPPPGPGRPLRWQRPANSGTPNTKLKEAPERNRKWKARRGLGPRALRSQARRLRASQGLG